MVQVKRKCDRGIKAMRRRMIRTRVSCSMLSLIIESCFIIASALTCVFTVCCCCWIINMYGHINYCYCLKKKKSGVVVSFWYQSLNGSRMVIGYGVSQFGCCVES